MIYILLGIILGWLIILSLASYYYKKDWEELIRLLLGVLLGAIIAILISDYFYDKATEDLIREAGQLKKISEHLLKENETQKRFILTQIKLMQAASLIDVKWDKGEPVDIFLGSGGIKLPGFKIEGTGTIKEAPSTKPKERD